MNNNNFKHFSKILSEFNSIVSQKAIDLSNISLFKCIIEKNMKAGILMNSSLIYCEESFIMNNNEYAISIKKKEHQFCFKDGKNNMINGSIGGNWGKIHLFSNVTCFSCIDRPKFDNKKKEEITKKIPSFINQSDKSFDRGRKTNYSYSTSPSDRVNKSSYKNDKRKLHGDLVTGKYPDEILAKSSAYGCKNLMSVLKLNLEHGVGEFFYNNTADFDHITF